MEENQKTGEENLQPSKSKRRVDDDQAIREDEVNLIELVRVIWSKKYFIAKITGIFFLIGIIVAFTSKVEYKASCKLIHQSTESGMPNLRGLGGLIGVNLQGLSQNDALNPELYPEIIQSTPFLDKLINTPVYFERLDTIISSYHYFTEFNKPSLIDYLLEYTVGLPGKFFKKDKNSILKDTIRIKRYPGKEWALIKSYANRLSIDIDLPTGIISIEAELPDPVAAAMTTSHLVEELTKSVTTYKIEKAKFSLSFIQERFTEAEKAYAINLKQLAQFNDHNQNITTSMVQNEYQRIQNELNISFDIYKSLATQLEQAKIRVKEETPIFAEFEPVMVPVSKSKPKKRVIIIGTFFLGVLISVIIVVVRDKNNLIR